jgi:hypothetical protein
MLSQKFSNESSERRETTFRKDSLTHEPGITVQNLEVQRAFVKKQVNTAIISFLIKKNNFVNNKCC